MENLLSEEMKEILVKSHYGLASEEEITSLNENTRLKKEIVQYQAELSRTDLQLSTWSPVEDISSDTTFGKVAMESPTFRVITQFNKIWLQAVAACILVILLALANILITEGKIDIDTISGIGLENNNDIELVELALE